MTEYKPHTEELRQAIIDKEINTVCVSTIETNGDISELIYDNFCVEDGICIADTHSVSLFDLVCYLYQEQLDSDTTSLNDVFLKYPGKIYFTSNKIFPQVARGEFKVREKDGSILPENDIVVVTAYLKQPKKLII